jgi:hypothetical protein
VTELTPFVVTNEPVAGEIRQVLRITNGMSLYFTPKDFVLWFGDGSSIVIEVEPKTGHPRNILLNRNASGDQPAESVLDINADGVGDLRQVRGTSPRKDIFYRGEWWQKETRGSNGVIKVDGKEIEVRFDGRRFMPVADRAFDGKPADGSKVP